MAVRPVMGVKPNHLRLFKYWFACGLFAAGVFVYGCLMHNPPNQPGIPYFDKIEHAGAFIVLGAWFGVILRPRYARVLVALSIFAAATEVLQWSTSYRDGDPLDWLADTLGACVGLLLVRSGAMNWLPAVDRLVTSAGNNTR